MASGSGIKTGSLVGNEFLQVTGLFGSKPSGVSEQVTVLQIAQTLGPSVVSSSALTLTTSATLTAVPGLSVNLTAGNSYLFEGYLSISASAGGGIAVNLGQGTVAAATFLAEEWLYNTTTLAAQGTTLALATSMPTYTGLATSLLFTGTIRPTTTGTFAVYAAQNVGGNASSTVVNVGSYLNVTRVS